MVNAFNNLFITITEKLNIQQIQKGYVISIIKDSFPGNFLSLKLIPITEAEIKSIIHSLKQKQKKKQKKSGYDERTRKILKACASLFIHPLSYICNHSLYIRTRIFF